MITVNALKIRNQFGEVLDMLDAGKDPILIEKRKQVRAVLISYEDFKIRFIDKLVEDEKNLFRQRVENHTTRALVNEDPVTYLRNLRGYAE